MALSEDCEAIVIGAGLGGLACAALLAEKNRRVLVLERNAWLVSRCYSFEIDGFTSTVERDYRTPRILLRGLLSMFLW